MLNAHLLQDGSSLSERLPVGRGGGRRLRSCGQRHETGRYLGNAKRVLNRL